MLVRHLYPAMLNLKDHLCVVIGGGAVAERKVRRLLDAGAVVRLVSPACTAYLQRQAEQGRLEWLRRPYEYGDAAGAFLLVCATSNRQVNAQAAAEGHASRALVNVADAPGEGSLIVPAIHRRGLICIAVSTCGRSPAAARLIRDHLAACLGPEHEELVSPIDERRGSATPEGDDPGD